MIKKHEPVIHGLVLRASDTFDAKSELHQRELSISERYRHAGRKKQFFLGRVAARRLLTCSKSVSQGQLGWIERTESGWPRPLDVQGNPLAISLSISHTGNLAVCALSPLSSGVVGIDVEQVDHRADSFYEDYFSRSEQDAIRQVDGAWSHSVGTVFWVIKEAVLKSIRLGLQVDARTVDVRDIHGPEFSSTWKRASVILHGENPPFVIWRWLNQDRKIALALSLMGQDLDESMQLDWREEEI